MTDGITSDPDGEWYSFTMPAGVTQSGSITSEGANGTAVTPAYFNNRNCMVLDFENSADLGSWALRTSMTISSTIRWVLDAERSSSSCRKASWTVAV